MSPQPFQLLFSFPSSNGWREGVSFSYGTQSAYVVLVYSNNLLSYTVLQLRSHWCNMRFFHIRLPSWLGTKTTNSSNLHIFTVQAYSTPFTTPSCLGASCYVEAFFYRFYLLRQCSLYHHIVFLLYCNSHLAPLSLSLPSCEGG